MKFDYKLIRPCDLVCCGAGKFVPSAMAIRSVTAGFKNIFNTKISTHSGIIMDLHGQLLICEMRSQGIRLSSLDIYNKRTKFVIVIRRNRVLSPPAIKLIQEELALYLRRAVEYDPKGLVEFINKKVKDDPRAFYCSELILQVTKPYLSYPSEFYRKVSPFDLQHVESGWYNLSNDALRK